MAERNKGRYIRFEKEAISTLDSKGEVFITITVDFLTKERAVNNNNGEVPMYYVEKSHPAIIDKEMWGNR